MLFKANFLTCPPQADTSIIHHSFFIIHSDKKCSMSV